MLTAKKHQRSSGSLLKSNAHAQEVIALNEAQAKVRVAKQLQN